MEPKNILNRRLMFYKYLMLFRFFLIFLIFSLSISCAGYSWKHALKENSINSYSNFIKNYPNSEFSEEAKNRLEDLHWERALSLNSVDGFVEYGNYYPKGKYYVEYIRKLNESEIKLEDDIWTNAKDSFSSDSLLNYIYEYPNGRYYNEALNKIIILEWKKAKSINSIIAFEELIKLFNKLNVKDDEIKKANIELENLNKIPSKVADKYYVLWSDCMNSENLKIHNIQSKYEDIKFHEIIKIENTISQGEKLIKSLVKEGGEKCNKKENTCIETTYIPPKSKWDNPKSVCSKWKSNSYTDYECLNYYQEKINNLSTNIAAAKNEVEPYLKEFDNKMNAEINEQNNQSKKICEKYAIPEVKQYYQDVKNIYNTETR